MAATPAASFGQPPVGTTLQVQHDKLTADELEAVSSSLVELCDLIVRQCSEVRQIVASSATEAGVEPGIAEGKLESLVPSRGSDR